MILTELRQRLDLANKWVMGNTPANDDTHWIRPVKTAICIACRAAWGDGVSIYASNVGRRDMGKWPHDPQRRPANLFVGLPEGHPNRAAHYTEASLPHGLRRYHVTSLAYQQSGPPKLLLAAELRFGSRPQVLQDFDSLRSSPAAYRVMVYNPDDAPVADLVNLIHYADTQAGGTYLFAAFADYGFTYEVYRDRREYRRHADRPLAGLHQSLTQPLAPPSAGASRRPRQGQQFPGRRGQLVSIKESIRFEGKQNLQTKAMIVLFGLFAEIERDLIVKRTKEGLAGARARGKRLGRPKGRGASRSSTARKTTSGRFWQRGSRRPPSPASWRSRRPLCITSSGRGSFRRGGLTAVTERESTFLNSQNCSVTIGYSSMSFGHK